MIAFLFDIISKILFLTCNIIWVCCFLIRCYKIYKPNTEEETNNPPSCCRKIRTRIEIFFAICDHIVNHSRYFTNALLFYIAFFEGNDDEL